MHSRLNGAWSLAGCVALCLLALSACSKPADSDSNSGAVGSKTASMDYSSLTRDVQQVQAGRKVFSNCAVCHSAEANQPSPAGPNLAGVVGRQIASVSGFPYSQALAKASGIWTPDRLNVFLKNPAAAYPGTAMAFGGLAKDADRKAVIAYLAGTGSK